MIKYIATTLLIVNMAVGLYIWLEDHDNTRLSVARLGTIILIAALLLLTIFLFDG